MSAESRATFFRQSGWLVIATVICGVFLIGVYSLVQTSLDFAELGSFMSMLRFFLVLGILTSGLQVVMAQQAAAAIDPESSRRLIASTSSVARGILLAWVAVVVVCVLRREWILQTLKLPHFATLAVTLGLLLAQLFLPFAQGLMQGQQQFGWLGWSIMFNGVGRFLGIWILLKCFVRNSTTALAGALVGLGGAVIIGAWPSRGLILARDRNSFRWGPWLRRVIPLTGGTGSLLFLMNADVLFVQAHYAREKTAFYSAVALLGIGLVSFTMPMAAVMFPKLVRSVAQSQKTDSVYLALAGTLVLGVCSALFCTVLPWLPLRIIFFRSPQLWESAQLVPWFMWSMLPMTLSNVLVNTLLARGDFRPVPWFVAIAVGYGFELNRFLGTSHSLELFTAFKGVILRLGLFSALILAVAILCTSVWPRQQPVAR